MFFQTSFNFFYTLFICRCLVAGWGETSFRQNNQPVTPMKQVNVNVVTYETCRAAFANASLLGTAVDTYLDVAYAEICAGGVSQLDACTVIKTILSIIFSIVNF